MVFSIILNDKRVLADLQSFDSGLQVMPPQDAKLFCLHFIYIRVILPKSRK